MNDIRLSDSEWEIMNCLWNTPHMKISQIVLELNTKRFWDKHTVITLLNRMENKGAVAYERKGRAKVYFPIVSQTEIVKKETEQFIERVYQGSLGMMVNSFIDTKSIKKDEIDELYNILKEAKKGQNND